MRTSRTTRLGPLLAGVAIAATTTGCFTTWAVSRAVGGLAWEEGVREEVVPLPGVTERLVVALPLQPPAQASTGATTGATAGATPVTAATPFALRCTTLQEGKDSVYHSGTVHGKNWKIATGMAAVFEAAAGATYLLAIPDDATADKRMQAKLFGGFLALDAIGTAVLFFLPKREVVRTDQRVTTTPVRSDCPDGLILDVGGDSFAIDAAGRIGEVGDVALAAWMQQPVGPLLVALDGRALDLRVGPAEQCAWQRAYAAGNAPACATLATTTSRRPDDATAVFDVPVGSLSSLPADTP